MKCSSPSSIPDQKLFTKDFLPDYQYGDLLARLLADRAEQDGDFKAELFRLANGDLPPVKRMLLAKAFSRFQGEDDLVAGLCVLRDDGSGVPYELLRIDRKRILGAAPVRSGRKLSSPLRRGDRMRSENAFSRWRKRTRCGSARHLRCSARSKCGGSSTVVPWTSRDILRSSRALIGRSNSRDRTIGEPLRRRSEARRDDRAHRVFVLSLCALLPRLLGCRSSSAELGGRSAFST